jgi:pimeloyl-ACP methyl ester carboxylesterase
MKSIKVNGIQVNDYGGMNTPLIFIHAFPLSGKMWKYQVDFFKNKFRVITYDVRGSGDSKSEDNQFMMENFVDDFFTILDVLNLEKSFVCGLSMGGYITLRASTKNPERFKGIILADTKSEKDDNTALINRSKLLTQIKQKGKIEFIDSFLMKLISGESYNNFNIKEFVYNIMYEQSGEGICGALIAIATRSDTSEDIKKLEIPTLIIVGEKDILTPLNFSENMKASINKSRLEIIPESGHLSNIEQPDIFNNKIDDFLKSIKARDEI